jgi:ferrochelatase
MSRYTAKTDFRHADSPRMGVLLANLGTPDAPTTPALRKYLGEFLADPRIVELPRLLWRILLHGLILRIRPAKSAALYEKVWTDQGSPLLVHAQAQAKGVERLLQERVQGPIAVELGMRYGRPSTPDALRRLREQGVERLLVLPLYPQYSGATTGSTFDAIADEFKRWRWVPEFRFIGQYHDHEGYIHSLAASIREHWKSHDRGEKLLFSFHGTPRAYLLKGDPYHCQCQKTARLVAEQLELSDDAWQVTFQSRFGKAKWLQPYTITTLAEYGKQGMRNVDVICPGFSSDCLETLEEIEGENATAFKEAGGGSLRYIPALNDRVDHLETLTDLVLEQAQGWPEVNGNEQRDARASAERAQALSASTDS